MFNAVDAGVESPEFEWASLRIGCQARGKKESKDAHEKPSLIALGRLLPTTLLTRIPTVSSSQRQDVVETPPLPRLLFRLFFLKVDLHIAGMHLALLDQGCEQNKKASKRDILFVVRYTGVQSTGPVLEFEKLQHDRRSAGHSREKRLIPLIQR